jgi:hypothetical protein
MKQSILKKPSSLKQICKPSQPSSRANSPTVNSTIKNVRFSGLDMDSSSDFQADWDEEEEIEELVNMTNSRLKSPIKENLKKKSSPLCSKEEIIPLRQLGIFGTPREETLPTVPYLNVTQSKLVTRSFSSASNYSTQRWPMNKNENIGDKKLLVDNTSKNEFLLLLLLLKKTK